ncbi:hypothetical protein [Marinomonas primoryensis]|jgi:hypothetical protein|uniref:hypothetical protein n=1 Tax=Marinomonas primoryensis TaxID=178399 RepID=UPI0026D60639
MSADTLSTIFPSKIEKLTVYAENTTLGLLTYGSKINDSDRLTPQTVLRTR